MRRKRSWGIALRAAVGAAAASWLVGGTALAQPPLGAARLGGQFQLNGRITVARNILGEQVGQRIVRTWTFTPICAVGPCARVALTRQRAGGVDHLVLKLTALNRYAGTGLFYAPLSCNGTTIAQGESVPFKVTVRVTRAAPVGGMLVATRVHATYTDLGRQNLTRCVAAHGRDAAVYNGPRVS